MILYLKTKCRYKLKFIIASIPMVIICAPRYQRLSVVIRKNIMRLFIIKFTIATIKNFTNCWCVTAKFLLENVQNFCREKLIKIAAAKAVLTAPKEDQCKISWRKNKRVKSTTAVIELDNTLFQKRQLCSIDKKLCICALYCISMR